MIASRHRDAGAGLPRERLPGTFCRCQGQLEEPFRFRPGLLHVTLRQPHVGVIAAVALVELGYYEALNAAVAGALAGWSVDITPNAIEVHVSRLLAKTLLELRGKLPDVHIPG